MTDEYIYACGNTPRVGDLIEYGTRSKRYIVTSINEEGSRYSIQVGDKALPEYALSQTRLIARHGQPSRANEKTTMKVDDPFKYIVSGVGSSADDVTKDLANALAMSMNVLRSSIGPYQKMNAQDAGKKALAKYLAKYAGTKS